MSQQPIHQQYWGYFVYSPCNPPGGAILKGINSRREFIFGENFLRLSKPKATFLKQNIKQYLPDASVYLFGSRTNDDQRGGDIDILIIGDRALTGQEKRDIKIAFYKQFGEQKIDLASYMKTDDSNFKNIALMEGIKLK